MKKGFIVLVLMVFASAALAGVVPVKQEKQWSGFYFGLNAGLARHEANWSDNDFDWYGGTLTNPYNTFLPGATIGYNHQSGSLVIGFEVDGALGLMENEIKYSLTDFPFFGSRGVTKTDKLEFLFTARGRLGFAIDKALFYLTAGVGLPRAAHTWIEFEDAPDSWQTFYNSNLGMVVGAGFEHRLGSGLTLKVEFLSFKNSPKSQPNLETPSPYYMSVDESVEVLRIGFNYLF